MEINPGRGLKDVGCTGNGVSPPIGIGTGWFGNMKDGNMPVAGIAICGGNIPVNGGVGL
jgi:hypothetical protein